MQKFYIGKYCFIFGILGISFFLMMDVPTAREFNNKIKVLPKYIPYFEKYNDYIQENFQYIRTLMATILCSGVALIMLPSPLICTINIILLLILVIVYYSQNYYENPVYYYAPNLFKFLGVIGGFFLLMGEPAFENNYKNQYEKKLRKIEKRRSQQKKKKQIEEEEKAMDHQKIEKSE